MFSTSCTVVSPSTITANLLSLFLICTILLIEVNRAYSTLDKDCTADDCEEPTVDDTNLKVEVISSGLKFPTTMTFLDNDDILVLELNGTVRRILDNILQTKPLLDLNVSRIIGERGLLGISASKDIPGHTYLFLYYTESRIDNGEPLGNRLYRYELINNRLLNPTLLLDLPALPGPYHNGGAITIGPDNNIYLPIGDLDNVDDEKGPETMAQNVENGQQPNGSGGILRITQN